MYSYSKLAVRKIMNTLEPQEEIKSSGKYQEKITKEALCALSVKALKKHIRRARPLKERVLLSLLNRSLWC